ncbi:hypothetical protein [Streptomyces sp. NPDC088760]|uniref:hypothetical protein n=1 Tax=Streptomyces sp. NPDC088760 TaxID=3365890 RepID=UPI003829AEFE
MEFFDGAQTGLQGAVGRRGGGQQECLGRGMVRVVEVVFAAVFAGDRVGLDFDPAVAGVCEVVGAAVVAVALGEDQAETVTDEPASSSAV